MLDFTELDKDGTKFEQLIREILLISDLRPRWTGKGPDSGRDLLVDETLRGGIQDAKRIWLVDCKHFAHSNRAVGVNDVIDIRDRCERVNATAYLLACSTTISSELARKLHELGGSNGFATEMWDSVTIEKLLLKPHSYFIAQQFFPVSMTDPAWRMFYTDREERWMAHFKGHFLYVESRAGIDPPPLSDLEDIIQELEHVRVAEGESLRVRGIWHDTPNGPFFSVGADYLVPSDSLPSLSPEALRKQLNDCCVDGGMVFWHVRLQITIPQSDYHSLDDPNYYGAYRQPLFRAFYGLGDLDDLVKLNKWTNQSPPLIRTFNDQLIWEQNKEKFGYSEIGGLQVRTI